MSERQLRRLTARAEKLLFEEQRTHRKKLLRLAVAQRQALYARAVQKGDERTALAVLRDLAELQPADPIAAYEQATTTTEDGAAQEGYRP